MVLWFHSVVIIFKQMNKTTVMEHYAGIEHFYDLFTFIDVYHFTTAVASNIKYFYRLRKRQFQIYFAVFRHIVEWQRNLNLHRSILSYC